MGATVPCTTLLWLSKAKCTISPCTSAYTFSSLQIDGQSYDTSSLRISFSIGRCGDDTTTGRIVRCVPNLPKGLLRGGNPRPATPRPSSFLLHQKPFGFHQSRSSKTFTFEQIVRQLFGQNRQECIPADPVHRDPFPSTHCCRQVQSQRSGCTVCLLNIFAWACRGAPPAP